MIEKTIKTYVHFPIPGLYHISHISDLTIFRIPGEEANYIFICRFEQVIPSTGKNGMTFLCWNCVTNSMVSFVEDIMVEKLGKVDPPDFSIARYDIPHDIPIGLVTIESLPVLSYFELGTMSGKTFIKIGAGEHIAADGLIPIFHCLRERDGEHVILSINRQVQLLGWVYEINFHVR